MLFIFYFLDLKEIIIIAPAVPNPTAMSTIGRDSVLGEVLPVGILKSFKGVNCAKIPRKPKITNAITNLVFVFIVALSYLLVFNYFM